MTLLKKKIEDELNNMDVRDMAAVYEHLRQLSRLRRHKPSTPVPSIKHLHELTATSNGSWSDALLSEREER